MKDIILKITGKQSSEDDSDQLEFVTEGKLYEKDDATYIIYDESESLGLAGCKTMLRLEGNKIRMKRIGDAGGTEFSFEKNKRFRSRYHTEYGTFDMEVLTNDVENNLDENGTGVIFIDYHVNLNGLAEGRNRLRIEVSE